MKTGIRAITVSCLSFSNSSFYSPPDSHCLGTCSRKTQDSPPCSFSILCSTTEQFSHSFQRFLSQFTAFLLQLAGLAAEKKADVIKSWAGAWAKTAPRGDPVKSRCTEKNPLPHSAVEQAKPAPDLFPSSSQIWEVPFQLQLAKPLHFLLLLDDCMQLPKLLTCLYFMFSRSPVLIFPLALSPSSPS